jgi:TolB protein
MMLPALLQWVISIFSFTLIAMVGMLGLLHQTSPEPMLLFLTSRDGTVEIYRMRIDGSYQQNLTQQCRGIRHENVAISPDRQWIIFDGKYDGENSYLYKMRLNGSCQQKLATVFGMVGQLEWSPDEEWIFFVSSQYYRNSWHPYIYRMRADGSDIQLLTQSPEYKEGSLSWSPDGQSIAFSRNGRIFRMRADGSDIQNITENPYYADGNPSWSPDGKWILFENHKSEIIYRMRPDGTDIQELTPPTIDAYNATWSPDGKWIIFSVSQDIISRLYRMRSDGTDIQELTSQAWDIIWSPDGKWIVFSSNRDEIEFDGNLEIYRIRPDGTELQNITNHPNHDEAIGFSSIIASGWHMERLLLSGGIGLLGIILLQVVKQRIARSV